MDWAAADFGAADFGAIGFADDAFTATVWDLAGLFDARVASRLGSANRSALLTGFPADLLAAGMSARGFATARVAAIFVWGLGFWAAAFAAAEFNRNAPATASAIK